MLDVLLRFRTNFVDVLLHYFSGKIFNVIQLVHIHLCWKRFAKLEHSLHFIKILLVRLISRVSHLQYLS